MLTDADRRAIRRFVKVLIAALVAQGVEWLNRGAPPVTWREFLIPVLAAALLSAEKRLQREKK